LKERHGYVVSGNPPRLVIQDSLDSTKWLVHFTTKTFPHELARLRGHQCLARPGLNLRFVEEDDGSISDILLDTPDVVNTHELSRIVSVLPNTNSQAGFAARSCGCTIHISNNAIISDFYGPLTIGMEVWHRSQVYKGRLEASEIEICLPTETGEKK
jgi:hypothetical protein